MLARASDEKPRWMSLKYMDISKSEQAGKHVPHRMNHYRGHDRPSYGKSSRHKNASDDLRERDTYQSKRDTMREPKHD
jgi:hypothetical protein